MKGRPLSYVNDREFKDLAAVLGWTCPSVETIKRLMEAEYDRIARAVLPTSLFISSHRQIKDALGNVDHVALSADGWSSRAGRSYFSLLCHFIAPTGHSMTLVLDVPAILSLYFLTAR